MTLRRPPVTFRSFLLLFPGLLFCVTNSSLADEAITEAAPRGVEVEDQEEPQVSLKEPQRSPFRSISRTRRKKTEDKLVELCKETVEVTSRRMLSTELHTPWQMIHALLGLRNEFSMLHNGEQISGLDWIAKGQTYENEYWFERTKHGGRAHPYSRPYAFEGHANQTIALISMCGVELDREFGVADGSVSMRDMIRHAQMSLSQKDEPTWTLWALSRYLPPSARWRSEDGEYWSIERLVQEQVAKPERGAPCGGTHGLFALAHARNVYLQQGKPLRGVWLQAEYKIRKYINTARVQQNSNGSLSSNYFRGREFNPDFNKRMASVGHVLEFLMIALPQNELNSQWVRRAIHSAASELMDNRKAYVKCSPLYHTVNALNIYLDRVNPAQPFEMAVKPGRKTVQVDKPKTSKVPAKTVSQGRVVAEAPAKLTPVKPVEKLKPVDITPTEDVGQKPLKVEAAAPKPVREQGGWKATPAERRNIVEVPESKTGGSDAGTNSKVQAETPATATEVRATTQPALTLPAAESTSKAPVQVPATPEATKPEASIEVPSVSEEIADSPAVVEEPAIKEQPEKVEATEADASASLETLSMPSAAKPVSEVTVTDPSLGLSADRTESSLTPVPDTQAVSVDTDTTRQLARPRKPKTSATTQQAIVSALQIRSGMSVAEVGSGEGQFVKAISDAIGSDGQFFAIEQSALLVEHLESIVEQGQLNNVYVVRNDDKSLQLMTRRVELVLMCDTYQKLSQPVSIVSSVQRTLKPGGDFVLVESRTLDSAERSTIIKNTTDAGFDFVADMNVPGFEAGTFLHFRRPF